jgi:hypothetical protein
MMFVHWYRNCCWSTDWEFLFFVCATPDMISYTYSFVYLQHLLGERLLIPIAVAVMRTRILCFAQKTSVIHTKKSGQHVQTRVLLVTLSLTNMIKRTNIRDHMPANSNLWTFPCHNLKTLTNLDLERLAFCLQSQDENMHRNEYQTSWLLLLLQASPKLVDMNKRKKTDLKVLVLVLSLSGR